MKSALPPLGELKDAARAVWPERRLRAFRVHEEGWTNLVLEADGSIIFRFPRGKEVADSLTFEVRLLDFLSRRITAPVPRPVRVSVLAHPRGWPFVAYPKLPGTPLSAVPALDSTGNRRLGEFVGRLLRELAVLPARPLLRMGAPPGDCRAWERKYRALEARYHRVGESRVSPIVRANVTRAFDQFYAVLRMSRYRPVATHQDLGPDHILWDPVSNRPTGVIDWEDLCLGDPAFDLTGLGSLGRSRVAAWVRERKAAKDSTFGERLSFYRRVIPIHGLLYASETRKPRMLRFYRSQLRDEFGS